MLRWCSSVAAIVATAVAASPTVYVDFYSTTDCSGPKLPNATLDLTLSTNPRCTRCWDRCGQPIISPGGPHRAFILRGDATQKVAANGNCVGRYGYTGGWTGPSIGGIKKVGDCNKGVPSALVMCSASIPSMQDDLDEICGHPIPTPPESQPVTPLHLLNASDFAQYLGDDLPWATHEIPFVEFDEAAVDSAVVRAYYYRWKLLKKHLKWTADGWVLTEFLPYVPWSGKHNAISAAAGHHIADARWLHDPSVHEDYSAFWYNDTSMSQDFGGTTSYTQWIGWATYNAWLVTGNTSHLRRILPLLAHAYTNKYVRKYSKAAAGQQCWWQGDGADAMEVSISGSGCRPTIASAMYGESMAIALMAEATGDAALAEKFKAVAATNADIVMRMHWNPETEMFATVPTKPTSGPSKGTPSAPDCNLTAARPVNRTVPVRELLGFMPWFFSGLIPRARAGTYLPMWRHLFDPQGFSGPFGLRTAERRSACYNYSWQHGDCWNGPSWPYETARVLTGAANVLNDYEPNPHLNSSRYFDLLVAYAKQHTDTTAVNDTAKPPGSGHVFENLHPDLGYWNNRHIMYENGGATRNQGDDYHHSTFMDLVITGLVGVRPKADAATLTVNPQVPAGARWFCLDGLKYKGKWITVSWDKTGHRYGTGAADAGLSVYVDGKIAARRASLGGGAFVVPL